MSYLSDYHEKPDWKADSVSADAIRNCPPADRGTVLTMEVTVEWESRIKGIRFVPSDEASPQPLDFLTELHPVADEPERLQDRVDALEWELGGLREERDACRSRFDVAVARADVMQNDLAEALADNTKLRQRFKELKRERDILADHGQRMSKEAADMAAERDALVRHRDATAGTVATIAADRNRWQAAFVEATARANGLQSNLAELQSQRDNLAIGLETKCKEAAELAKELETVRAELAATANTCREAEAVGGKFAKALGKLNERLQLEINQAVWLAKERDDLKTKLADMTKRRDELAEAFHRAF